MQFTKHPRAFRGKKSICKKFAFFSAQKKPSDGEQHFLHFYVLEAAFRCGTRPGLPMVFFSNQKSQFG
jgi:hypothetical protein